MSRRPLALVPLLFAVALGCTPPPEQTCEKLHKLSEEAASKNDKKPISMSKCLDMMNEMKERDAAAYKCTAKLVAKLSNFDTALMAIGICDKNRPDKKKTDDDDAPKSKKKKSSDDD